MCFHNLSNQSHFKTGRSIEEWYPATIFQSFDFARISLDIIFPFNWGVAKDTGFIEQQANCSIDTAKPILN